MIHEVGSWQHFVKRQDNVGLPIMEVKQKYLKEMNSSPIDLSNIDQGGGSRRTTPAPMIYVFNLASCCIYLTQATVYTTSASIIVGTIFYTTPELTTRFNGAEYYGEYIIGNCITNEFVGNAIYINGLGVVTAINQNLNCLD
jgi:hypothetical protein